MITIKDETRKEIEELAASYNLKIIYNSNTNSIFEEYVSVSRREIVIKESIEVSHFDYMFKQHGKDYAVKRDQEMFLFNTLHGIGHFVLSLWTPNTPDKIYNRMVNFGQDEKIDKWAFDRLMEIRKKSKNENKKT